MTDECCTTCLSCGRRYCRDEETSPGEESGICPTCWETENPEGDAA